MTRARMRIGLATLALVTVALGISLAWAEAQPRARLQRVEAELEESSRAVEALTAERQRQQARLAEIQAQSVAIAQRQTALERDLRRLEAELSAAETRSDQLLNRLDTRAQRQAEVMVTLVRLQRVPRQALLARRGAPGDAVRTSILLQAILPAIENEGDTLRRDLALLASLTQRLIEARQGLAATQGALEDERLALHALLDERAQLLQATEMALERASERQRGLAAEADTLDALVTRLRESESDPDSAPRPRYADGIPLPPDKPETDVAGLAQAASMVLSPAADSLIQPVGGTLVQRFGDRDPLTGPVKGLTFEGRNLTTVVAPRAGRVVYAERFRSYGKMLIIDHGDTYYSVLAGLGRFTVVAGQAVVAGEPVAEMPATRSGATTLYFEYQRDRTPIDPAPLLARTDDAEDTL